MSVRSVIAVLGGLVVIAFLSQLLEVPLVRWLASEPLTDMAGYLVARNQPAGRLAMLAIAGVTGVLGGYLVAKVAGQYEMGHAGVAALLQALLLVRGFFGAEAAAMLPLWVRAGLVLVTVPAMLLGAAVRARAAKLTPVNEVES